MHIDTWVTTLFAASALGWAAIRWLGTVHRTVALVRCPEDGHCREIGVEERPLMGAADVVECSRPGEAPLLGAEIRCNKECMSLVCGHAPKARPSVPQPLGR